jgi:hypothetical protein
LFSRSLLLKPSLADSKFAFPPGWGFGLPVVYATWVLVVALLSPPSRWFAGVKQRGSDPWLSYV